MIVITRNGKTTVITGWRAWLMSAVVCATIAVTLVIAAFLVLGIAITIATLLIFAVPLALAFALIASLIRPVWRL